MDKYDVTFPVMLPLGKQGENRAKQIRFDISNWTRSFGPGTVQLLHQRKDDEAPYPVAVEQEENLAIWTVTNADTAAAGNGCAELQYYVDGTLVKTANWITTVLEALGPVSETPPEAQQGWVDQVLQAGAEAAKAAAAAVHQPMVGSNGNWWTWDLDTGAYADTGIYSGGEAPYIGENGNWFVGETDFGVPATGPQGPQGPAGVPGTVAFDALTDEQVAMLKGEKGDTGETGLRGPRGYQGVPGLDGEDGFSPEVYSEEINGGYILHVTTAAGSISFPVYHGSDGPQGPTGPKGEQGPSGVSGVYVGSGDMPEGYSVQVDPDGEAVDYIQSPATAEIGQTIVVKSVDENGKPTEWESADVASIPDVTEEDNGKFLRVVAGVWAASTIPSAEEASF